MDFLAPLKSGGCFFEMGAGKTRVALELLKRWESNLALVVAPKTVLQVWEREVQKHCQGQFQVKVLTGSMTLRAKQAAQNTIPRKGTILAVNYEAVWREPLATMIKEAIPDVIILDEGHRIKAPGGKASRFLSRLGLVARRRLVLTGTPLPHSPLDAYALYRFLDPKIFGYSFTRFRARYAVMGGYGGYEVKGWQNLDELNQKMYSIACRVRTEDVLDLPETMDEVRTFTLSPKARKIYQDLEKNLLADLEQGQVSAANVMVKLLRLQQLCGGWLAPDDGNPERVDNGKADLLEDIMMDMGQEQVVVFCRFHQDMESVIGICKKLDLKYAELSGRRNELGTWQEWEAQVLIAQLQSGGLGIDLTQARHCFFYSHGWSLGDYMQARARVHRPGQTRPVVYYHLVAAKTVDERVMQALEKREDLVKYVVDGLKCRK